MTAQNISNKIQLNSSLHSSKTKTNKSFLYKAIKLRLQELEYIICAVYALIHACVNACEKTNVSDDDGDGDENSIDDAFGSKVKVWKKLVTPNKVKKKINKNK